jgi:hypothetical protein
VSAVNVDKAQVASTEAAYAALGGTSAADLQSLQTAVDTLTAQAAAAQSMVDAANAALANQTGASAADVQAAQTALDQAQAQKLDLICRKLRLKPGERFLDIGCGWGGLIMHAAEHYGVHGAVDLTMGTFSKVFGVTGGFLAGDRELIRFLRFTARSYVFSAAPAPTVLAAVAAGLDLVERAPELRTQLFDNTRYVVERLRRRGLCVRQRAGRHDAASACGWTPRSWNRSRGSWGSMTSRSRGGSN